MSSIRCLFYTFLDDEICNINTAECTECDIFCFRKIMQQRISSNQFGGVSDHRDAQKKELPHMQSSESREMLKRQPRCAN